MTDQVERYRQTWSGQRLLEKHSETEHGLWEVRGEDPNTSMGGPHHRPMLGHYTGTLGEVIALAVTLPGFWQWGNGGDIRRIEPQPAVQPKPAPDVDGNLMTRVRQAWHDDSCYLNPVVQGRNVVVGWVVYRYGNADELGNPQPVTAPQKTREDAAVEALVAAP